MKTPDQYAAEDDAFAAQAQSQRATKEADKDAPPNPFTVFTSGATGVQAFDTAVAAADRMTGGKSFPIYHHVRDLAALFYGQYEPGDALEDAVAKMCIPLLGAALMADHAKATADSGHGPEVRFADLRSALHLAEHEFLQALKIAHPGLVSEFLGYLADSRSEVDLDDEIRKDVKDSITSTLLTSSGSLLKDAGRAVHVAVGAGAATTSDVAAEHPHNKLAFIAAAKKGDLTPESFQRERAKVASGDYSSSSSGHPGMTLEQFSRHQRYVAGESDE